MSSLRNDAVQLATHFDGWRRLHKRLLGAELSGKRCTIGLLFMLTILFFIIFCHTSLISTTRFDVAVQSSVHRQSKHSGNGSILLEENVLALLDGRPITKEEKTTLTNQVELPSYVREFYDQMNIGSAAFRPRRRFATFVLVSDKSEYQNDVSVLSSAVITMATDECFKQPSDEVDAGYQLYVIGPRDQMPAKTGELESSVASALRTSNCSGDVIASVLAIDGSMVVALNNAAFDAYLDREADYFRLVLPHTFTNRERTRLMSDRRVALDDRMTPSGHGMIVDIGNSTSVAPFASVFFGAGHFEVFGWMLPPETADVMSGLKLLITGYEGHNLTQFLQLYSATGLEQAYTNITTHMQSSPRLSVTLNAEKSSQHFSEIRDSLKRYLVARSASRCWRCSLEPATAVKVISMSLYGSSRRYTVGAVRNAQLLPVTFPGWRLRIYCELSSTLHGGGTKYPAVPVTVLRRLVQLGVDLHPVETSRAGGVSENLAPMLWRFAIAVDKSIDAFIVRDADSRLTPRDGAVVSDWLIGHPDSAFHCVRDHPSHSSYSVSGGLWGGRPRMLASAFRSSSPPLDFNRAMRGYSAAYVDDMVFLCRDVWPRVQHVAFCHDSFSCDRFAASHPFPVPRVGSEHLGQVYNEFSVGRQGDMDILRGAPINRKCVP